MVTTTQFQRPQLATDWSKTQTPPPTLIGTSETGEPVISSPDLATGLGVKHKSLLETIRTHITSVEHFGHLPFQTATVKNSVGAANETTLCYLNENQALFVGSLSRNTVQVVAFKVTLVREFDKARKVLATKEVEPNVMVQAMAELVSQLSAQVAAQSKKLTTIERNQEKYIEAKVVANSRAFTEKVKTDKQKQREDLFTLFERYMKVHSYRSGSDVIGLLLDAMREYFNIDLTIQKRDVGEHYFDVAIRFDMGYAVEQCLRSHLPKSGDLK